MDPMLFDHFSVQFKLNCLNSFAQTPTSNDFSIANSIRDHDGPPDSEVFKIVGSRRRSSLGIDNFTGGLFPDTELPCLV